MLPLVLLATAMTTQAPDAANIGIRIDSVTPEKDDSVVAMSVQVSDFSTGEVVTDADVEVTFHQGDDPPSKPQALEGDGEGYYRGDVTFPDGGEWTIDVTANGGGNVQLTQTVAEPAEPESDEPASTDTDDDGGSTGTVLAVAAVALAAVVVLTLLVVRRRRSRDEPTG